MTKKWNKQMFSKSSIPHLECLCWSLPCSPGWSHPSRGHGTPALPASSLPEHLCGSCQQNRHPNSSKKQKSSPLWLLLTPWGRADLWCFASLLSIIWWWLPAGNLWVWASKRSRRGQVRCACAFHRTLFRVGVSKGSWIIFIPSFCCGGTDLC